MRAAVYARVSTERQERQQTIEKPAHCPACLGRRARPRSRCRAHFPRRGVSVAPDSIVRAWIPCATLSAMGPSSRRRAHPRPPGPQVRIPGAAARGISACRLRGGVLAAPDSDDPNDQLLLQIQGAIAEYERAVLAERFRRGKFRGRGKARSSVPRHPMATATSRAARQAGCLVIDEAEAGVVRQLYNWVAR